MTESQKVMTPLDAWDLSILSLCVWREARGEPRDAKLGVAWTAINRASKPGWWGGPDLTSVILHPLQYSSFNHGDPNSLKFPSVSSDSFVECLNVCNSALGHDIGGLDPTGGATHFFDSSIEPPYWAKGKEPLAVLGKLRFYKVE